MHGCFDDSLINIILTYTRVYPLGFSRVLFPSQDQQSLAAGGEFRMFVVCQCEAAENGFAAVVRGS